MTSSIDRKIAAARYRMLLERTAQPGFARAGLTDTATPRFGPAETAKPLPAGLTPAAQYSGTLGDRVNAIEDAFTRYRAADIEPPPEWAEERQRIGEFLVARPEEPGALAQMDYRQAMNRRLINEEVLRDLSDEDMKPSQIIRMPAAQPEIKQTVPLALASLTAAMKADPSYALSWHANIAMSFYDEWARQPSEIVLPNSYLQNMRRIANAAATEFMRKAFNVAVVHDGKRAAVVQSKVGDITTMAYCDDTNGATAGLRVVLEDVRKIIDEECGMPAGAAQQCRQEPNTAERVYANYRHAERILAAGARQLEEGMKPKRQIALGGEKQIADETGSFTE